MGGVMNAIKGVVDMVAPIASLIPGVGLFAMAAKVAVDVGSGLMSSMDKKQEQDQADARTDAKHTATAKAAQTDMGGAGNLLGGILGGGGGGGVGDMLGGLLGGGGGGGLLGSVLGGII